ncbi:hypothetical protein IL252_02995 [Halomicrobium sp. IBSBa]|uniref:hypothetical protein n=1 Tax=Halomicrobium sp. IBSBa TaxID=2778916 RepID=UPI001ABFDC9E|nr:hypothetical protein [Halomicrobium sp. IBSBa]MBO4246783.1 hypothetical protein [Halomicrobium sp. IBSBa]
MLKCKICGDRYAKQFGQCAKCTAKIGKKKKKNCTGSGCGKTIVKKITKSAIRKGVMEAVCPGCGITVEFSVDL